MTLALDKLPTPGTEKAIDACLAANSNKPLLDFTIVTEQRLAMAVTFAQHKDDCGLLLVGPIGGPYDIAKPCTCGLDAFLALLGGK